MDKDITRPIKDLSPFEVASDQNMHLREKISKLKAENKILKDKLKECYIYAPYGGVLRKEIEQALEKIK